MLLRGICGTCDAFSAPSWFMIWRERWPSWVFVVGTVRRGNSCYHDDLIGCYFHVGAALPLPFPPRSSLLFTWNNWYPFLTTKGEEKGDLLSSRTSSLLSLLIRHFHVLFSSTFLLNPKDSQGQWTQGKEIDTAVRRIPWLASQADHRTSASGTPSSPATARFTLQILVLTVKNPFYRHWSSFFALDSEGWQVTENGCNSLFCPW